MKQFFEKINAVYEDSFKCRVGPYNDFPDTGTRIYLDEVKSQHFIERFLILNNRISRILDLCFNNSDKLTYVFSTSDENNDFPIEDFDSLQLFGLNTSKADTEFASIFDEDDEWYLHYLATSQDKSMLPRLIWGTLACNFDITPYFIPDMFVFSECNRTFINIYDDRGMDIISLDRELIDEIKNIKYD